MAKVNLNLEIDVQDAFLALTQSEKEEFLAKNIDYIGGISDVVGACFNDWETTDFLEQEIDKISNDVLLAEIERRGLN
jgi:hypothetical protein